MRTGESMSWEDKVRRVVPYVPGEQPKQKGIIKLNTNENPYPPAPEVERLLGEIDYSTLRLYPDTDAGELTKELAAYSGLKPSQIFVGVGSDDVLSMAFLTFFIRKNRFFFPTLLILFMMYGQTYTGFLTGCVPSTTVSG